MDNNKRPVLCYLFLKRIPDDKADFSTIVPIRTARILQSAAEVHVIYAGSLNENRLRDEGITCHRYSGFLSRLSLFSCIGIAFRARKLSRRYPDVVMQNVWAHYLLLPVCLIARTGRVRLLARIAGVPISRRSRSPTLFRKLKNLFGRWLEFRALNCADHVIALSHSLKTEYMERGIDPARITMLSQGVDTEFFRPGERSRREELQLLFVGRLSREKGLDDLLQACRMVLRDHQLPVRLVIAGGGNEKEMSRYQALLEKLELTARTEMLGFVSHDQLPHLYRDSDLLVVPSHTEGLPNVVLEAMAMKVPCLVTRVDENPRICDDNRGFLVDPGRPDQLADGIVSLLTGDHDVTAMTQRAYEYVQQEHSFAILKERYRALLVG